MHFEDEEGDLSKPRLFIFTSSAQSAEKVFRDYAHRWWDPTCRKFEPNIGAERPGETARSGKNAWRRQSKNNRAAHPPSPS
jgi:hypothetical protein